MNPYKLWSEWKPPITGERVIRVTRLINLNGDDSRWFAFFTLSNKQIYFNVSDFGYRYVDKLPFQAIPFHKQPNWWVTADGEYVKTLYTGIQIRNDPNIDVFCPNNIEMRIFHTVLKLPNDTQS